MTNQTRIGADLKECLISPNVIDSNLEAANVVDVIQRVANAIFAVARELARIGDVMEKNK